MQLLANGACLFYRHPFLLILGKRDIPIMGATGLGIRVAQYRKRNSGGSLIGLGKTKPHEDQSLRQVVFFSETVSRR